MELTVEISTLNIFSRDCLKEGCEAQNKATGRRVWLYLELITQATVFIIFCLHSLPLSFPPQRISIAPQQCVYSLLLLE